MSAYLEGKGEGGPHGMACAINGGALQQVYSAASLVMHDYPAHGNNVASSQLQFVRMSRLRWSSSSRTTQHLRLTSPLVPLKPAD